MNIGIITSSFPSHSRDYVQAPFLLPFIGGLKKRGHGVFVFTQDREGAKEDFPEGVRVIRFPWLGSKRPLVHLNPIKPLDCLRIGSLLINGRGKLLPFLRENRVDACLALWVLPGGYFGNYAHRKIGMRYSVWCLGSDIYRYGKNPFLYPLMKRILREANGVFADGFDLSRRVEERFERKCFFLATTRGLETVSRGENDGAKRSDRSDRTYHFLFVGRLEKVKGIDVLLHAAATLSRTRTDFMITVVGTGSLGQWARDFAAGRGMAERVSFESNIPDERLSSLYLSSDCIVIPSRSESIPVVLSEALRVDRALIVTDVGDMGMLGRKYGIASVVPPEDAAALAEAMEKRLATGEGETDGGISAKREELKALFDTERSVDRFLADYV